MKQLSALIRLVGQVDLIAKTINYLHHLGILHNTRYCESSHEMSLHVSETHDNWRCKDCHVAAGLRKGTRLEERKLPFDTIIFFTYSWSNEYTTTKICAEKLSDCSSNIKLEKLFKRGLCRCTFIKPVENWR